MKEFDLAFYKNKRVLVTGHTGFKGSWLCHFLINIGAKVTGFALTPPTEPSLFNIIRLDRYVDSNVGDIRDLEQLKAVVDKAKPEIVFHLAAQPIVRESYADPVYTYQTNVLGTVNILECIRKTPCVRSFLNVTTDKVYLNKEWKWGYREIDPLDGFDPYSNSKSCSELVTNCYKNSFFYERDLSVSTARAGNVIGGGDFSKDRIIPDCFRSAIENKPIIVRNPYSIRPYQHVLEPVYAYLMIAARQYQNKQLAGSYNIGPNDSDCYKTGDLVDLFIKHWGNGLTWINKHDGGPHEANFLKLDCSRIKNKFSWSPRWDLDMAVAKVVEWNRLWLEKGIISALMDRQISEFLSEKR